MAMTMSDARAQLRAKRDDVPRTVWRASSAAASIAAALAGILLAGGARAGQVVPPEPREILRRTLESYGRLKSYQATWTYTLKRGDQTQVLRVEIAARPPTRLACTMRLAPGQKPPERDAIPEMRVVVDGRTAWFENTTAGEHFKTPLPKDARVSPLAALPRLRADGEVRRLEIPGGLHVLVASSADGGVSRLEIDAATHRIRKVATEAVVGLVKVASTLEVEKETIDAEVPDSAFTYRPPRGSREVPAPPGASALFGVSAEPL